MVVLGKGVSRELFLIGLGGFWGLGDWKRVIVRGWVFLGFVFRGYAIARDLFAVE